MLIKTLRYTRIIQYDLTNLRKLSVGCGSFTLTFRYEHKTSWLINQLFHWIPCLFNKQPRRIPAEGDRKSGGATTARAHANISGNSEPNEIYTLTLVLRHHATPVRGLQLTGVDRTSAGFASRQNPPFLGPSTPQFCRKRSYVQYPPRHIQHAPKIKSSTSQY